ncbi:MAG: peptidyl-alpha-hydroxyglycine alpha-amidating lyase family protein [Dehalococcoidia bacterium]|jgi:DNA-binding beta-propeller fold protein YncE|nr:peptidyl-alpha-hydroxyglycine alpha-amidating lyase family protein [Dehalococcoidia bacterium]
MTNGEKFQEYGLPRATHEEADGASGSVILGEGDYRYEVTGKDWGNLPEGWFYKEATSVAVDQQDRVFVFNRGNMPVIVYDTEGNMIDSWGEGVFANPHGISVDLDGNLFCVDNNDSTVKKFTPTGELLMTLGEANKPAPPMSGRPFSAPTHVAADPSNGDFYVSDGYSNARVHKFTADGELASSWGESGTDEGQFNIVHNIAIDSEGLLYVADRENHRIQIFDRDGKYIDQWVNMARTAAIYIDTRGSEDLVYIGEYFSGIGSNHMGTELGPRVSVMNTKGEVLARVGTESYGSQHGRFFTPHGISVDSGGNIYLAEVSHSDYGSNWNIDGYLRSLQKLVRQW